MSKKKDPDKKMFTQLAKEFEKTGKIYRGVRHPKNSIELPYCVVEVTVMPDNGRSYELNPPGVRDAQNPEIIVFCFDWGPHGDEMKANWLANSLLMDLFGNIAIVRKLMKPFYENVIRKLPDMCWTMTGEEIWNMYDAEICLLVLDSMSKIEKG